LFADAQRLSDAYADAGESILLSDAEAVIGEGGGYIEPLLHNLGAAHVDSLDASDYERATLVHDLNLPLPDELRGKYSLVLDGGSLEHVFNFPQALRNCMDAVELGGHLLLMTPANNQFGHGFYQFSPDLFYRAFAPENGFAMVIMLIRASHSWARWRHVSDPRVVGGRVTLTSPWSSLLFVLAKRTSPVEPFATPPQQSDYVAAWSDATRPISGRARWYEQLPAPARRVARLGAALAGTTSHRDHFKSVRMSDLGRRPLP
jgi:SAM-dependent methyltransferase